MFLLQFIIWNASPCITRLGSLELRWYGLAWAIGFIAAQRLMVYIFRKEGRPAQDADTFAMYILIGTFLGARLGHVFFYEWEYYAKHLAEALLPVRFAPRLTFTGYQGLASHGAACGIVLAIYLYTRCRLHTRWPFVRIVPRPGQSYLWLADRLVIAVALVGCLIRVGNFANSEIVGKPTAQAYGVVFAHQPLMKVQHSSRAIESVILQKACDLAKENQPSQACLHVKFKYGGFEEKTITGFVEHGVGRLLREDVEMRRHLQASPGQPLRYHLAKDRRGAYTAHINVQPISRHPAQLYESLSCAILAVGLFYRWKRKQSALHNGELFGVFLTFVFGLRFLYENLKESKMLVEESYFGSLSVPHLLSVPFFLIGIALWVYSARKEPSR